MDDFYSHINKDWFSAFKLPKDHVRYNSFDCVSSLIKEQLWDILIEEEKKDTIMGKMFKNLKKESQKQKMLSNVCRPSRLRIICRWQRQAWAMSKGVSGNTLWSMGQLGRPHGLSFKHFN